MQILIFLPVIILFLNSSSASTSAVASGITFDTVTGLPILVLPYGTWRASHYNDDADVYTFRNIRYAAPPVGNRRWKKPAPPEFNPWVQDGSEGHNCIPVLLPGMEDDPMFEDIVGNEAEDCLFLDVYVPRRALVPGLLMNVVVWFHGGGFTTGSKDQAHHLGYFDGTGLIQQAHNDLIIVTINYRLGAFGFLAGEPLKNNTGADEDPWIFNAGLHDQRAALSWVQSYIYLLGGNPYNVSAWGNSAGAASIMYHLTAEGGTLHPLFNRAFIQSPGLGSGADLERQYGRFDQFASLAGCNIGDEKDQEGKVMDCLLSANTSTLARANQEVFYFESSPVPDGEYIQQTALVEFANGNYWPHLESLMVSHVIDEGTLMLPSPIPPGYLEEYIYFQFPRQSHHIAQRMVDYYTHHYANASEVQMLTEMTRDLMITCHLRAVVQAYPNSTWATQYSFLDGVLNGLHSSETVAQWYNPTLGGKEEKRFEEYQRYITSHARWGDPNGVRQEVYWPRVEGVEEERLRGVLEMHNEGFGLIEDGQVLKSTCDLWSGLLVEGATV